MMWGNQRSARGQNQKWLHNPHGLGAHLWAKWLHNPYCIGGPQQGAEIRNGYITPAILGTHMWAKWHKTPCRLGGLQSEEDSKLIHGLFHIGNGQQVHHLWGGAGRPQWEMQQIKRGKWYIGVVVA